jgi:hypothetical protein
MAIRGTAIWLSVMAWLSGGISTGAFAMPLVWETGSTSGTATPIFPGAGVVESTGAFTFDQGSVQVDGVDYWSATSTTPGAFVGDSEGEGTLTGQWSCTFNASSTVFGTTQGLYEIFTTPPTRQWIENGDTLALSASITFNGTPALPSFLTDLRFDATLTISNVQWDGNSLLLSYDFSGPFQLTAVPEPSTVVLLTLGLVGLAVLRRR